MSPVYSTEKCIECISGTNRLVHIESSSTYKIEPGEHEMLCELLSSYLDASTTRGRNREVRRIFYELGSKALWRIEYFGIHTGEGIQVSHLV